MIYMCVYIYIYMYDLSLSIYVYMLIHSYTYVIHVCVADRVTSKVAEGVCGSARVRCGVGCWWGVRGAHGFAGGARNGANGDVIVFVPPRTTA